jgi:acyl-CoA reductase-like NAD-dependent aldehyde dehydrogenase
MTQLLSPPPCPALPCLDQWRALSVETRVKRVCALRHMLATNPQPFIDAIQLPFRRSTVETLAAEIIPLADACKFLEQNAPRLLRPRPLALRGRPLWLWGNRSQIHRVPLGRVLIISPGNYPLMLAGIQTIQALVAGNGVLFKPAPGTRPLALLFAESLHSLGVPKAAMIVLDESPEAAKRYYDQIDKVILTGSVRSGKAVASDLAEHLKPAVMELSGCDAAIVLPGADLALAASCIRFGLAFNGSNSCIAPRRILAHTAVADGLAAELCKLLPTVPPVQLPEHVCCHVTELGKEAVASGAKLISGDWPSDGTMAPLLLDHAMPAMRLQQEDIFAPVASIVRVNSIAAIHAANAMCPFRLGASVFGTIPEAQQLARESNVGSVCINDLMAPTSDPRLPFGGAGVSGFGSTRGAEGLLEMTQPKTISVSRGALRFHLQPDTDSTPNLLQGLLKFSHAASWSERFAGLKQLIAAGRATQRETHP